MKYLSLLAVTVFALSAHAQTASSSSAVDASGPAHTSATQTTSTAANASSASQRSATAAQAGNASASAAEATDFSAELTKKVDSKKAKVGDEVAARTTSAARLSDGTKIPKGTRLLGKVTDVQAKSADQKASRLAFTFDRAVMHDGSAIPIRATVMSLAAPAPMSASAAGDDEMSAGVGPEPAPVMMRGGGGGDRASGRGLLGEGGGTLRSVSNVAGGTASGLGTTAHNTLGTTTNTLAATRTTSLQQAKHVTGSVTNMPGVNFSSGGSANESAVLNANGKNIDLASGTQMTLSISANQ
ncbi:MAG TPA: hypothetical protein VMA71_09150 [Alloacidobacterium sp.]|nr:hypothetical protein [Alloacidobacterium sp.]